MATLDLNYFSLIKIGAKMDKWKFYIRILAVLTFTILTFVFELIHASMIETPLKAVMQVNASKIDVIKRGMQNALEISQEAQKRGITVDLKLIVSGPSVDQFERNMSPEIRKLFRELLVHDDIHVFVCGATLKRIHKSMKSLLPGLLEVASGPLEVLLLEQQGYFYLKP